MTVSIALCTYNGEKYLSEQLDSIMNQSILPDEIIICDDGSKDATVEILNSYYKKYPDTFKIFTNETNLGYTKNFEKAINLCSKDLIIMSDQDDIWKVDKIKKTLRFFETHPEFDAVFNDLEIVDNNKNTLEPSYLGWKNISYDYITHQIKEKELLISLLEKGCFVLGCALAVKRKTFADYNLTNFSEGHDYFIAKRLGFKNKLGFIAETLSFYRQHPEQVCGLNTPGTEKKDIHSVNISEKKVKFKELVWPFLSAVKEGKEFYPHEDIKKTELYLKFKFNRNKYLKSLNFLDRKIYIFQCIRYHYLDLRPADLFII